MKKPESVEQYLSDFSGTVRDRLDELRAVIRKAAPKAEECISYGMPAYRAGRVLVYFAACKSHIGFYPTATPMDAFKEELATYTTTKGAIHFPLDKKIPAALVKQIVQYRLAEEIAHAESKKAKKAGGA